MNATISNAKTIAGVQWLAEHWDRYQDLRRAHPAVPARLIVGYMLRGYDYPSFEAFVCECTTGHKFVCTGTAYGGDDESYHGEGRCYCANCGADGDA